MARTRGSAIEPGAGRRGGTKETKGAGRTDAAAPGQRSARLAPAARGGARPGCECPSRFPPPPLRGGRTHPPRFGFCTPKPRYLASECPTPSRESSGGSSFLLSDQTLTRRLQLAPHPARVAKHVLLSPLPLAPHPVLARDGPAKPRPTHPRAAFRPSAVGTAGPTPPAWRRGGCGAGTGAPWGSVPGSHLRRLHRGCVWVWSGASPDCSPETKRVVVVTPQVRPRHREAGGRPFIDDLLPFNIKNLVPSCLRKESGH